MSDASRSSPPLARALRRAWLAGLVGSIAALVILMLLGIIAGDALRSDLPSRVMGVVAIAPVFCTLGVLAATVIGRRQLAGFMTVAMVLTVGAMVTWMILAWRQMGSQPVESLPVLKGAVSVTMVALWLCVTGYLLTSPRRRRRLVVARGVLVTSLTIAVAAGLLLLWSRWWQGRMEAPAVALALGVLGMFLGGIVLLGLNWRESARVKPAGESVPRKVAITLCCPTCALEQVMNAGLAHCRECDTALLIDVEEPHCECGYLLYRLAGESCPECGRTIPARDRWG